MEFAKYLNIKRKVFYDYLQAGHLKRATVYGRKSSVLLEFIRKINLLHFVWMAVLASELFTVIMSIILRGRITYDYLVTGGVVSLIVASMLIFLIDHMRKTEESLDEKTTSLHNILRSSRDMAIVVTDNNLNIKYYNPRAETLFGHKTGDAVGKSFIEIHPEDTKGHSQLEKAIKIIREHGKYKYTIEQHHDDEIRYTRMRASTVLDKDEKLVGYMFFAQDITARRRAQEQIHYLAYFDSLTGLPNRTFYQELVPRALEQAKRRHTLLAVLFIDLDNFKRINDSFSHKTGDLLLKQAAERLLKSLRSSDYIARSELVRGDETVSRLGGDEFLVLLTDIKDIQDVARVSRRLLKDFSQPFDLIGQEVVMSASIGISIFPEDGENHECLLKNADIAMYHAKDKGKNNYQFYSDTMNVETFERLALENDLRRALEWNEFQLYYQPKVHAPEGKIIGVEALIRWNHPHMGVVTPNQFIQLAEETGLIVPIGEWVLQQACLQHRAWLDAGFHPIKVAVNLSSRQFEKKQLAQVVQQALSNAGMDPRYLELEITESLIMQNLEEAIKILDQLKSKGIEILIDDFGKGYSSLNYLRRIPLDALKIDRSFVMNIITNPDDAAIVKAIIAMAHNLQLKVIAEGIETEEQMALLQKHGCHEMQGYLWSKPLDADEITKLLIKGNIEKPRHTSKRSPVVKT
jgi:PAS domain S-box-containing protein